MPLRRFRRKRAARKIQRRWRKYKSKKTSGYAMAKKINHNGMYFHREKVVSAIRFNNTGPNSGAYIDTVSGDGFYCLTASADEVDNFMPLSGVFKRYKITGVKFEIFPNTRLGAQQQLVTGWTGTQSNPAPPAPQTINVDEVKYQPNMYDQSKVIYWKNRYVDSTNWTTSNEVMESDAKRKNFNRPWSHFMVPRIQEQSTYIKFDGTTDTYDMTRSKKAWLDVSNADILHRGVRICIQNLVANNYNFSQSPPPVLKLLKTYYITFQGQQ